MPDGLGRRGLSDLVDRAIVRRRQRCIALIVLDVSILKDLGVAPEVGIVVRGWIDHEGSSFRRFVDVKDGDGAKTRRLTSHATGSSRNGNGDAAVVSIVKKHEREFAGRVGGDKRRAMLGKEP